MGMLERLIYIFLAILSDNEDEGATGQIEGPAVPDLSDDENDAAARNDGKE